MSFIDSMAEEKSFSLQKELYTRINGDKPPVIFDVGGNIGQSIQGYKSLFPSGIITSFEPLPDCFETMNTQYGSIDSVTVENFALSESPGTMPFYATNCKAASSLLEPDPGVQKKSVKGNYDYQIIEVPVDTLDNYCQKNAIRHIDILKIDVQGAEAKVLRGAQKMLRQQAIEIIYLEVLFAANYQKQCSLTLLDSFLNEFEYTLWDVKPFLFTRSGRLWTANALFVSNKVCAKLESYPDEFPHDKHI